MSDTPNRLNDILKLLAPLAGGAVAAASPAAGRFVGGAADIYTASDQQRLKHEEANQNYALRLQDLKRLNQQADDAHQASVIEQTKANRALQGGQDYAKRLRELSQQKQAQQQSFAGPLTPDMTESQQSEASNMANQASIAETGDVKGAAELGQQFEQTRAVNKERLQSLNLTDQWRRDELAQRKQYQNDMTVTRRSAEARLEGGKDTSPAQYEEMKRVVGGFNMQYPGGLNNPDVRQAAKDQNAGILKRVDEYTSALAGLQNAGKIKQPPENSKGLPAPAGYEPTGKFMVNQKTGQRQQVFRDTSTGSFGFLPGATPQ